MSHYTDGRVWSNKHNAWVFESADVSESARTAGSAPDVIQKARLRGAIDFAHKVKVGDNPFHENDARHWAWLQGFSDAGFDAA